MKNVKLATPLVLAALGCAAGIAPSFAHADSANVKSWKSYAYTAARDACERGSSMTVKGVAVKVASCTAFEETCAYAGIPYVSTVGHCITTYRMSLSGLDRRAYDCSQTGVVTTHGSWLQGPSKPSCYASTNNA